MYKWQAPSRGGVDGRKAGVCRSLVTGEVVTRKKLSLKFEEKETSHADQG